MDNTHPAIIIDSSTSAFISPLMEAIHGRKLSISEKKNRGHALTSYALLHTRQQRAFNNSIKLLNEEEKRRIEEGLNSRTPGNPLFALDAFQEVVYRAAEMFEFYESDLIDFFNLHRLVDKASITNYKTAIKNIRRPWSLICNKCKHNHSFLVPVEGLYADGSWVAGFCLVSRHNEEIIIDTDLHDQIEVFSYNIALRSIFLDILKADMLSASLLSNTPESDPFVPIESFGITLPYNFVIPQIFNRPRHMMPKEHRYFSNDIKLDNNNIEIIETFSSPEKCWPLKLVIYLHYIGSEISFILPYKLGAMAMKTRAELEKAAFPGFIRAVINVDYNEGPDDVDHP